MSARRQPDTIRIPRRTFTLVAALVVVVVGLLVVIALSAVAQANAPREVASAASMQTQQGAAERDVERAYEQAALQIAKVRALNLAISTAQADQIAAKANADLKALRHSAFVSLGQILGMTGGDADQYATVAEGRYEQAPVSRASASPSPVLLAPRFYTIVSRMSELSTQISDNATNALTASPSQTPAPTAKPSASPSPTR